MTKTQNPKLTVGHPERSEETRRVSNFEFRILNLFRISSPTGSGIRFRIFNPKQGFGLIEIVIVTAVVTTVFFAFLQTGILAVRLLRAEKENLEAALLAQEALEAVRSVRDESWTNNIAPLPNSTSYYPIVENSKWRLATNSPGLTNGKYTRSILFDQTLRDSQDRITLAGTPDTGTRRVTARTQWLKGNSTSTIELVTYITNFHEPLGGPSESNVISYETPATDADLANFPANNSGNGDPAQSFTTLASSLQVTKVELLLRRATTSPSDIYAELRQGPTGAVLGASSLITATTIPNGFSSWVAFRFPDPVSLAALTTYHMRLRSTPSSTDAFSGSAGPIHWIYQQTPPSPYPGGDARRYIGRLSNSADTGQLLDQYDFGFRVYALQ